MTLIDPTTTTTTRRRRRRSSTAGATSTAKTSTATRVVRSALTAVWLLGMPLFSAVYVDQKFGAALGVVPQVGFNVAGLLTLVAATVAAVVLHHQHAVFTLAVIPAAASWIGYVGFGGGVGGWLGLFAGLGIGLIAYAIRRRKNR
jgi:hypothetical protein